MSATKIKVILDKGLTRAQRIEAAHASKAQRAAAYMARRAQSRKGSR